MESQIRVLIMDDHAVLRAGLKMMLNAEDDMTVVGDTASASSALDLLQTQRPDVVLLDISMPDVNGLEILKEMKRLAPASHFLILTMHNDEGYLRIALSSGASGYVLKQAANNELLSAIRVVSQGGTYLHADHRGIFFESERVKDAPASPETHEGYERLSPREKEILKLIVMGYTNRQAAEELFLSEKTIETYKSRLMSKLGLHSRVELVRYAIQVGLIKQ